MCIAAAGVTMMQMMASLIFFKIFFIFLCFTII